MCETVHELTAGVVYGLPEIDRTCSFSERPPPVLVDESSVAAVEAALEGRGDIEERVEVLTTILKRSLTAAAI